MAVAAFTILAFLAVLAGCASSVPPRQTEEELEQLISAYRRQTERSGERDARRQGQGVRTFQVERRADRPDWLVTAQLERASLSNVVRRMLDETQTPYFVRVASLPGEVTARFERLPMRAALSLLLEGQGLSAWDQQGVLIIGDDPPATSGAAPAEQLEAPHPLPPSAPLSPSSAVPSEAPAATPATDTPSSAPKAVVSRAIQLRHMDVATVATMFEALYPVDSATGSRPVRVAAQPFTSTVLLSGAQPAVASASRLLGELDRDPAHVLLEVLVVEFDSNELERLGMSLQQLQSGRVSNLATQFANPAQNSLSFLYTSGANAPVMYRAMIDVLSAQDKARVIARPYTAAMSGRRAAVQIARSRDIQQRATSDFGGNVSMPAPVTRESGVKLDVTPWVQADGRIRLELSVEESVFIDDLATNVISETDKSSAATTMMVASGESIIIGGLTVRRKSSTNAGIPWLRHVPVLNFFAAQRESAEQKQDVIIYITPYIIGAGVDLPFPLPDAFKFRDGRDDLTEVETPTSNK
jgi:type II secretory pathway component GspD/PulD (secretin)